MTITEGTPVTAVESGTGGLVNFVRIGGPPGATDGCVVLLGCSHNRNSGSLETALTLTGPGTADAVLAGQVHGAAGAHYGAVWLIPVPDASAIPAVGETNPPDMWTVSAFQVSNGNQSPGDFACSAFVLDGANLPAPLDALTPFAQATTTTLLWDTAATTVADVTTYYYGSTERALSITPAGPLAELVEVQSANPTAGRPTTLFLGKVHTPVAGDPGDQSASLGATARQWRTFAFGVRPAALSADAGSDQTVPAGTRVTLTGTGQLMTGGSWAQVPEVGVPDMILLDADTPVAQFTAENETTSPISADFVFTATDGSGTATDTMTVTIEPVTEVVEPGLEVRVCQGGAYV